MNNQDLDAILEQYPTLTTHGFGLDPGSRADFGKERDTLATLGPEFDQCRLWLSSLRRRQTPNKRIGTTYRLKHVVERWQYETTGGPLYIQEGALIAAALSMRFAWQRITGRTSVYLGISSGNDLR